MSKSKTLYDLKQVEPEGYSYFPGNHRFGLKFCLKKRNHLCDKSIAVIQMNGSSAGWSKTKRSWVSDPTIGKVLCWCGEQGYNTVHCLNLWSYVDKNPLNLIGLPNTVLNKFENDLWIKKICDSVDVVVLAHGNCNGVNWSFFEERKREILQLLQSIKLFHVGELNNSGNPKHGRSWNGKPKLNEFIK
ncbi:DUF1643 domain-containing protein [Paenibacillus cellulositrophicus]|uniref:DUF1643 domain-containing protein n=1 Tax=Paenibacillus cellulositrophicus TaxID=562959 RepID=UPI003D952706